MRLRASQPDATASLPRVRHGETGSAGEQTHRASDVPAQSSLFVGVLRRGSLFAGDQTLQASVPARSRSPRGSLSVGDQTGEARSIPARRRSFFASAERRNSLFVTDQAHEAPGVPPRRSSFFGSESRRSSLVSCLGQGLGLVTEGEDPGTSMFADPEAIKEKLRRSLIKPKYDVSTFYKQTGFCRLIATSSKFEYATLSVIALNAIWIAVDTDLNSQAATLLDAHPVFQLAEHFFCAFFSFEWTVRFGAFQNKLNGLQDMWFVFDSIMVFLMVAETWVLSIFLLATGSAGGGGLGDAAILRLLRLLRLSRMARMARLLRSMPELLFLIKGMASAMKSLAYTLGLLFVLIYIFAIAFRQLTDGTEVGVLYFGNMFKAAHTLLLDGTLLDSTGTVVQALEKESLALVLVFYVFILLAALTVLNMLIGVLCEVVTAVASAEREQITVEMVKDGFMDIIGGIDTNNDKTINKAEFESIVSNPAATNLLNRVEVDVFALVDLADFIFAKEIPEDDDFDGDDTQELTFEAFMDIVLSLRGTNQANVKEIVDLRKFIRGSFRILEDRIRDRGMAVTGVHPERKHSVISLPPQVVTPPCPPSVPPNLLLHSPRRSERLERMPVLRTLDLRDSAQQLDRVPEPDEEFPWEYADTSSDDDTWEHVARLEGILIATQHEVVRLLEDFPPAVVANKPSVGNKESEAFLSLNRGLAGEDAIGIPAHTHNSLCSTSTLSFHTFDPLAGTMPDSAESCRTRTPASVSTRAPSEDKDEEGSSALRTRLVRLEQVLSAGVGELQGIRELMQ
mmetsp:Transcript_24503/g.56859  ORF Transcript_24503/g.56859 Transcript_24503/m.56859 type:complete len:795 (+) Transcript_24503:110-2494(+)